MQKHYSSASGDFLLVFLQSIVSAIPDPTVVVDISRRMICLNAAMGKTIQQGAALIGMDVAELGIADSFVLSNSIAKAFEAGGSQEELYCDLGDGNAQSYQVTWSLLATPEDAAQQLIGIFLQNHPREDVTVEGNEAIAQQAVAAELEAVLESIGDGVYVGNMEGVSFANSAALEMLGYTDLAQLNKSIITLNEQLQSKDATTGEPITRAQTPFLRALNGESVTMDIIVRHQLSGEQRIMRSATSPVVKNGNIIGAVAINTDVTNQRHAEEKLRQSEEQQVFLLNFSDAIRFISDPIAIQDIATKMLGQYLQTDRAFYARMDEKAQQSFVEREFVRYQSISLIGHHQYADFGVAVTTMSAGMPFIADDTSSVPELDPQRENYQAMDFNSLMATPLIKNGEMVACMCVTQCTARHWKQSELQLLEEVAERTWAAVQRAYSESALQQRETELRTFIAASSDMVYRMSADWKQLQQVSSENFELQADQINSNWMHQYVPKKEHPRLKAEIQEAIAKKSMFQLEHEVTEIGGATGWRHCRAIPIFDSNGEIKEWLATASDITQRKLAQQQLQELTFELEQQVRERTAELQESRDQLKLIFDTTNTQISILQALRDQDGKIIDLRIKFVNRELEKETERTDLVGKLYGQEYPGIRETALFTMIEKTIETGEPQQAEYYYPYEGFNKWYYCMFVKLGDGVVASNMDITSSKLAQEEKFKNYLLLQQSEELAALGSWDYQSNSNIFVWSDGMYQLFELEQGTVVTPEIYLTYATDEGRPAAARLVENIRSGIGGFNEILELSIAGKRKSLQVKTTVIKNENGTAARVLGVDMDVTAARAAEETIRRMEAEQQQEIFRVTLNSQEEERRRISESLHNGLAQSLYGIKMSVGQLSTELAAENREEFLQTKAYTEKLLTDAIADSRRISHELMPSVLEDFGLKAAIDDICKQLRGEITFRCNFSGLKERPDRLTELAVFRTVQELAMNVVKHAGATKGNITVSFRKTGIFVQVRDNGRGMEDSQVSDGIGLASIRSKVRLLNGKMKIESSSKVGTSVTVEIPQQERE